MLQIQLKHIQNYGTNMGIILRVFIKNIINKTGTVHITLRAVCATIVTVVKQ